MLLFITHRQMLRNTPRVEGIIAMPHTDSLPVVTTHRMVPPSAKGWVRDIRVRWALNEAGMAHTIEPLAHEAVRDAGFAARQPFHQMPCYRDDVVDLFESGAIVLHIARSSPALMPIDPAGAARTTAWMFAALNSIEPWTTQLVEVDLFHKDKPWAAERRGELVTKVDKRLGQLAAYLDDKPYLETDFSAGDLLMADVLRALGEDAVLARHANLAAYRARCLARPGYVAAYRGQIELYGDGGTA